MTQMTHSDWISLAALRAIERLEPITDGELTHELREDLDRAGLVPASKVDRAFVARLLRDWRHADVVRADFAPDESDHLGRLRPGARRAYSLTLAGENERRRLERVAGVLAY